ncbi:MAG TPA: hypothetical protein VLY84_00330 [Dysgonamonadaceae bacterium]|nr:hypothetical protein [Dysgonamonadaceae bacterium]
MLYENQKTPENHELLARGLFNWATDAHNMAGPHDFKEDLETMFRAFLSSPFADSQKNRESILVLYDHFNSLFTMLGQHNHQDFRNLDLLNLKLGLNVS